MQYTNNSSVLFNFLKAYVPEEDVTDIFLYVQDVTIAIDFHVLQYSSEFGDMLALVDSLHDPQVLELEYVYIDSFNTHHLFIKVHRRKSPLTLEEIKNRILPLKYMIPVCR
jgi:hypothetical protein